MRVCVRQYLHRSRVIEKLIEEWKTKQVDCTSTTFLAALFSECVDVADFCQKTWDYVRELARIDPNGDEIDRVGKIMKPELPRTLAAFGWIRDLLPKKNDDRVEGTPAFEAAANQLREVSAKFAMVFPDLNKDMAEKSRAEFLRGECIPIEDLIREAQGYGAPAH